MRSAVTPTLFDRLTRRRRVVRELEPADMGTCFGMEQTLDQPEAEPMVAATPKRSWLPDWLHSPRQGQA